MSEIFIKKGYVSNTDLDRLNSLEDENIDYSNIPKSHDKSWEKSKFFSLSTKQVTYIRIDKDVMDFFKKQGKGYQAKINEALKEYVKSKIDCE